MRTQSAAPAVSPHAQGGFTLVELIMVVAILGTLAVSAVPKFIDLSDDAEQAAVDGIAGQLASAAAMNYAACAAGNTKESDATITNCKQIANLLASGALPDGYEIKDEKISDGGSKTCTVRMEDDNSVKAEFVGVDYPGT